MYETRQSLRVGVRHLSASAGIPYVAVNDPSALWDVNLKSFSSSLCAERRNRVDIKGEISSAKTVLELRVLGSGTYQRLTTWQSVLVIVRAVSFVWASTE